MSLVNPSNSFVIMSEKGYGFQPGNSKINHLSPDSITILQEKIKNTNSDLFHLEGNNPIIGPVTNPSSTSLLFVSNTASPSQPVANPLPDQEPQAEHSSASLPIAITATNSRSQHIQISSPKTVPGKQLHIDPVANPVASQLGAGNTVPEDPAN